MRSFKKFHIKGILQKLSVFILGLLTILVLLEIILRITGAVQNYMVKSRTELGRATESTVMCLGDSYTYCPGVEPDKTYPVQLQDLLNSMKMKKKYRVINLGVNAQNTTNLLKKIEYNLDKYRPEIVVLMTGGSNTWDYYGYYKFLKGDSILTGLQDYIYRIRVFKLIKLFFLMSKGRDSEEDTPIEPEDDEKNSQYGDMAFALMEQRQFKEAIIYLEKAIKESPKNASYYDGMSTVYLELCKFNFAVQYSRKAIELNPDNSKYYDHLSTIYWNLNEKKYSIQVLVSGLKTPDTEFNRVEKARIINHLLNICEEENSIHYPNALKLLEDNIRTDPMMKIFLDIFKSSFKDRSGIKQWIISDIEKIISICKGKKVKMIMQNYPVEHPKEFPAIFEEIAKSNKIVFIDNFRIFKSMPNYHSYFLPDTHCNERGNYLIAENVFNVIRTLE